jgi:hypothetical protein
MVRHAFLLLVATSISLTAQFPGLTLPPDGDNQRAAVTQYIGPVKLTIDYSSPKVHSPQGEDRRGKIWGGLVPYGEGDLGFLPGVRSPWRAGANMNTTFEVSHDVLVQGKPLPAGRYGLHMIPGKESWTLIFNRNENGWGSYFYDPKDDQLRVQASPGAHPYREFLTYEFTERYSNKARAAMQWEDLIVSWSIEVPNVNDIYVSALRRELSGGHAWQSAAWQAAAKFCADNNTHLEQGLQWADNAISLPFAGRQNYNTLSTKAEILSKLNRKSEAETLMKEAVAHPSATAVNIHLYARQLQIQNRHAEALELFELNGRRHPGEWPVEVGLMRLHAAKGDVRTALEHARKALDQAPDPMNKANLEKAVATLLSGQTTLN